MTVTPAPTIRFALATLAGFAIMKTGSKFAMVFAMLAMSFCTPASNFVPQMAVLSGKAIQVRVCGWVSPGK